MFQPFALIALLLSVPAHRVVTAKRPLLQVGRIDALSWAPVCHLHEEKEMFSFGSFNEQTMISDKLTLEKRK